MGSWARRSPKSGFDLLQGFALCLWDEEHGEDDVEDAHKGKHPKGSCAGQNILKEIPVRDNTCKLVWTIIMN